MRFRQNLMKNPTWHSNISYSHIFFMFLIFILKHETWYIQLREGILALCAQILWNWSTKIREKTYTWWIMDTCICGSEKVVLILFLYFFFNTSGWQMSNSHMRWKIIYFSKYDFSFHFEKSFWLLFILPNSDSTTHIIIIIIINKDDLSIRSRTRNNRSKLICSSADHPNLVTNINCLISYKPLPFG